MKKNCTLNLLKMSYSQFTKPDRDGCVTFYESNFIFLFKLMNYEKMLSVKVNVCIYKMHWCFLYLIYHSSKCKLKFIPIEYFLKFSTEVLPLFCGICQLLSFVYFLFSINVSAGQSPAFVRSVLHLVINFL